MDDLIIVDCQYDFIDGSLACGHSHEAVKYLVDFVNSHEVRCLYTSDWHSETNGSFAVNGGTWPVHCVAGTEGAALSPDFKAGIKEKSNQPCPTNLFLKGIRDDVEEYSAFNGVNSEGKFLATVASSKVYVGGIASEYCVKETILSLLQSGRQVIVLSEGIGYVDKAGHEKTMEELKAMGLEIIG